PFMAHKNRLLVFSRCLIRALLASTAMIVILSTTRFTQLLDGLKALGAPLVFIRMASFMYRYIFILEDEMEKMKRALACRSVSPRKGWLHFKVFANLLGVLFIRAFERSERIYLAMQARGYDGTAGN
ncbi:MAG: energy-coupling factor transporter transmembrane component T family protein, partial [Candidatus Omnitrophota bacterium]